MDSRLVEVTILLDTQQAPPDLMQRLETAICPDAGEPGHEHRCPIRLMGMTPYGRRSQLPFHQTQHVIATTSLRMLQAREAFWRERIGDADWEQAVQDWRQRLTGSNDTKENT